MCKPFTGNSQKSWTTYLFTKTLKYLSTEFHTKATLSSQILCFSHKSKCHNVPYHLSLILVKEIGIRFHRRLTTTNVLKKRREPYKNFVIAGVCKSMLNLMLYILGNLIFLDIIDNIILNRKEHFGIKKIRFAETFRFCIFRTSRSEQ